MPKLNRRQEEKKHDVERGCDAKSSGKETTKENFDETDGVNLSSERTENALRTNITSGLENSVDKEQIVHGKCSDFSKKVIQRHENGDQVLDKSEGNDHKFQIPPKVTVSKKGRKTVVKSTRSPACEVVPETPVLNSDLTVVAETPVIREACDAVDSVSDVIPGTEASVARNDMEIPSRAGNNDTVSKRKMTVDDDCKSNKDTDSVQLLDSYSEDSEKADMTVAIESESEVRNQDIVTESDENHVSGIQFADKNQVTVSQSEVEKQVVENVVTQIGEGNAQQGLENQTLMTQSDKETQASVVMGSFPTITEKDNGITKPKSFFRGRTTSKLGMKKLNSADKILSPIKDMDEPHLTQKSQTSSDSSLASTQESVSVLLPQKAFTPTQGSSMLDKRSSESDCSSDDLGRRPKRKCFSLKLSPQTENSKEGKVCKTAEKEQSSDQDSELVEMHSKSVDHNPKSVDQKPESTDPKMELVNVFEKSDSFEESGDLNTESDSIVKSSDHNLASMDQPTSSVIQDSCHSSVEVKKAKFNKLKRRSPRSSSASIVSTSSGSIEKRSRSLRSQNHCTNNTSKLFESAESLDVVVETQDLDMQSKESPHLQEKNDIIAQFQESGDNENSAVRTEDICEEEAKSEAITVPETVEDGVEMVNIDEDKTEMAVPETFEDDVNESHGIESEMDDEIEAIPDTVESDMDKEEDIGVIGAADDLEDKCTEGLGMERDVGAGALDSPKAEDDETEAPVEEAGACCNETGFGVTEGGRQIKSQGLPLRRNMQKAESASVDTTEEVKAVEIAAAVEGNQDSEGDLLKISQSDIQSTLLSNRTLRKLEKLERSHHDSPDDIFMMDSEKPVGCEFASDTENSDADMMMQAQNQEDMLGLVGEGLQTESEGVVSQSQVARKSGNVLEVDTISCDLEGNNQGKDDVERDVQKMGEGAGELDTAGKSGQDNRNCDSDNDASQKEVPKRGRKRKVVRGLAQRLKNSETQSSLSSFLSSNAVVEKVVPSRDTSPVFKGSPNKTSQGMSQAMSSQRDSESVCRRGSSSSASENLLQGKFTKSCDVFKKGQSSLERQNLFEKLTQDSDVIEIQMEEEEPEVITIPDSVQSDQERKHVKGKSQELKRSGKVEGTQGRSQCNENSQDLKSSQRKSDDRIQEGRSNRRRHQDMKKSEQWSQFLEMKKSKQLSKRSRDQESLEKNEELLRSPMTINISQVTATERQTSEISQMAIAESCDEMDGESLSSSPLPDILGTSSRFHTVSV